MPKGKNLTVIGLSERTIINYINQIKITGDPARDEEELNKASDLFGRHLYSKFSDEDIEEMNDTLWGKIRDLYARKADKETVEALETLLGKAREAGAEDLEARLSSLEDKHQERTYLRLGKAAMRGNRWDEVYNYLRAGLERNRTSSELWLEMGNSILNIQEGHNVAHNVATFRELRYLVNEIINDRGYYTGANNIDTLALECYSMALEHADEREYHDIGNRIVNLHHVHTPYILKMYDKFILKHPDKAVFWCMRGNVLEKGNAQAKEEARQCYNTALEIYPSYLLAKQHLNKLRLQQA